MSRDWEKDFTKWAQKPSDTEQQRCENAVNAVKNAIDASAALKHRSIKVFTQGSYRNRVNVRKDSDVDIGVLCSDAYYYNFPPGKTLASYGHVPATYHYPQFKNELEQALIAKFGPLAVTRRNKAIGVRETSYHVEADVVPLFEFQQRYESGGVLCGVALRPDNGGQIENYPERLLSTWPNIPLHYEQGVSKNTATGRAFKGVVRIVKTLCNEMAAAGIPAAGGIPGYLIECLVWNAPDDGFKHSTWDATVQSVLGSIWLATQKDTTCNGWTEVDGIKYLFHLTQPWTRAEAHAFVNAAWDYIGVRR